jgi:hypothetical protein
MIENTIERMTKLVKNLQNSILLDIEDIKNAKHEELLKRNDEKHFMIEEITTLKANLNEQLIAKINEGIDVNIYRDSVDLLENDLNKLNDLNKKLASIVLPVQQMYKDLVQEISDANGGQIFDLKA